MDIADFIVEAGLEPSKTKARNLIRQGGFKLNNVKLTDENAKIFFSEETGWFLVAKKDSYGQH